MYGNTYQKVFFVGTSFQQIRQIVIFSKSDKTDWEVFFFFFLIQDLKSSKWWSQVSSQGKSNST